jgi:hypothetical protein
MFECREMNGGWFRRGLGFLVLGALAATVLGFVVMGLWNSLLPPLFGFKPLHFWQALGLLVLSKLLFGNFHSGRSRHFRHHQRLLQRWEGMTPEEREKFKQGFRGRFCRGHGTDQR